VSQTQDFEFKIGLVGPSRVGKTSLFAAIAKDAPRLFEGTSFRIVPADGPTEIRMTDQMEELDGALLAGEFNPGAVQGTQTDSTLKFRIHSGGYAPGIEFNIRDYPGGWIDPKVRARDHIAKEAWESECEPHLKSSTILIIPVEATVLMEAVESRHRASMPKVLSTASVAAVAREWAKTRNERREEAAVVLFCPVKCESYFSDNGGRNDKSDDLFGLVRQVYSSVIDAVQGEASHAEILYCPVDTVGCVEIVSTTWLEQSIDGQTVMFPSSDFRVRKDRNGKAAARIKGADNVLIAICQAFVGMQTAKAGEEANEFGEIADDAEEHAEESEGFFGDLWMWATGERDERREFAEDARTAANAKQRIAESFGDAMKRLAGMSFSDRKRQIR